MTEVLVWILVLVSNDGGILKIDNIRSWEDCERLRIRNEATVSPYRRQRISGTCTQVGILVPTASPAPIINVQPTPVTVQNTVVIKRGKK